MWLKVYFTNIDPNVIATYFIETDHGTDIVAMEQMQIFLRRDTADDFAFPWSFLYEQAITLLFKQSHSKDGKLLEHTLKRE